MRPLSDPESGPASHTDAGGPGAPRHPVRSLMSLATLTGGLTELALVGAHALIYPLGTRTEQLRPDPRCRPGEQPPAVRALFAADPLAARVPVVLVHGLIDNHSVFAVMRRSLRRRGFASVCSWNYSPLLSDVARGARDLGRADGLRPLLQAGPAAATGGRSTAATTWSIWSRAAGRWRRRWAGCGEPRGR